jgi:hypothetical protein
LLLVVSNDLVVAQKKISGKPVISLMQCRMVMAMKANPVLCSDVMAMSNKGIVVNKTACVHRKMNHIHIARHVLHGLMMVIRLST